MAEKVEKEAETLELKLQVRFDLKAMEKLEEMLALERRVEENL